MTIASVTSKAVGCAVLLSTLACDTDSSLETEDDVGLSQTGSESNTDAAASPSGGTDSDSSMTDEASNRCGQLAPPVKAVVGYVTTWGRGPGSFETLDWETLTHLNIAFGNPKSATDPTIDFGIENEVIKGWVEEAHSHDVKVLMSLAGINDSELVREYLEEDKRDLLLDSLDDTLENLNLDGVDVDIEGGAVDATYGPFVQALAGRLRPEGKLVTSAIGAWFQESIKDDALFCFDFINIMSYDKHGAWGSAGEHSPYLTAVSELLYWKSERGYPQDRIVLGVPFYGYCWGPGCKLKYTPYYHLLNNFPASAESDYIVESDYTISHNTQETISRKVKKAMDYGGVMIWELSQDKQGELSLMKAIKDTLAEE
jgi:GH18 family chitinase